MKLFSNVSIEELKEGDKTEPVLKPVLKKESEIEIYARITNFAGLDEARTFEHHEQYELKSEQPSTGNKGKFRVRKVTSAGGSITYEFTTKVKQSEHGIAINVEETSEISESHFHAARSLATSMMEKTRYFFPVRNVKFRMTGEHERFITVPTITFEVDVFPGKHGDTTQWCKIDLELDSLLAEIDTLPEKVDLINLKVNTANIPLGLQDAFIGHLATPEQQSNLDELFKNIFVTQL